ncbi:conserved hypothetical protein [Ricinus communis]|uniref:Uncharacterized protein n=1 Tax=Ricinus communis TaxID=3988 RepID=B9SEB1_RICCO|nr:conserved hypothetical protein [Ricinus communis]
MDPSRMPDPPTNLFSSPLPFPFYIARTKEAVTTTKNNLPVPPKPTSTSVIYTRESPALKTLREIARSISPANYLCHSKQYRILQDFIN